MRYNKAVTSFHLPLAQRAQRAQALNSWTPGPSTTHRGQSKVTDATARCVDFAPGAGDWRAFRVLHATSSVLMSRLLTMGVALPDQGRVRLLEQRSARGRQARHEQGEVGISTEAISIFDCRA